MHRMNPGNVRDLLHRVYQATAEETLWPQIVAALKQAPWEPDKTTASIGQTVANYASVPGGTPHLADSVSQLSYQAGDVPLSGDRVRPLTGRVSFDLPRSGVGGGDIPAGGKMLAPETIASLCVAPLGHRPELNLLGPAAAAPSQAATQEQDDLEQTVMRHTFLALQIAGKVEGLREQGWAAEAGLGRLAIGMVLIDRSKQATPMNDEARAILAKGDLELRNGRLTTADKRARTQLDSLLDGLSEGKAGRPTGGGVTVRRMNGHSLQIWAVPLRQEERAFLDRRERPCGILFVIDPDRAPATPSHLLMEAFGLTRAETTLTLALLYGETVDEYCERTGISRNTARTHMRAIFDKFGINKQTELMRMLSGFRLLNMGDCE
jgi:DNA-binding CsgD family transcriptional regulator